MHGLILLAVELESGGVAEWCSLSNLVGYSHLG